MVLGLDGLNSKILLYSAKIGKIISMTWFREDETLIMSLEFYQLLLRWWYMYFKMVSTYHPDISSPTVISFRRVEWSEQLSSSTDGGVGAGLASSGPSRENFLSWWLCFVGS